VILLITLYWISINNYINDELILPRERTAFQDLGFGKAMSSQQVQNFLEN
jgi:hypothetical protein